MPLPTSDAIPFRGIPSLGDKATIALSITLTQKQVEAMFTRQASINKLASQSATQFPLEIDFDKKVIEFSQKFISLLFYRFAENVYWGCRNSL